MSSAPQIRNAPSLSQACQNFSHFNNQDLNCLPHKNPVVDNQYTSPVMSSNFSPASQVGQYATFVPTMPVVSPAHTFQHYIQTVDIWWLSQFQIKDGMWNVKKMERSPLNKKCCHLSLQMVNCCWFWCWMRTDLFVRWFARRKEVYRVSRRGEKSWQMVSFLCDSDFKIQVIHEIKEINGLKNLMHW